jgi:hypothetical protein
VPRLDAGNRAGRHAGTGGQLALAQIRAPAQRTQDAPEIPEICKLCPVQDFRHG